MKNLDYNIEGTDCLLVAMKLLEWDWSKGGKLYSHVTFNNSQEDEFME